MDQRAHGSAQSAGLGNGLLQGARAARYRLGDPDAVPTAIAGAAAVHNEDASASVGDHHNAVGGGRANARPGRVQLHGHRAGGGAGAGEGDGLSLVDIGLGRTLAGVAAGSRSRLGVGFGLNLD
eukprot:10759394-Alexandrium_andersonii.AAC.1